MKLIVTEKNDAAGQIARLLSDSGKPKADKVYDTPVYRFRRGGEDCVTIGLRGHILQPDFPPELKFNDEEGWFGVTAEGEVLPADVPDGLARPPYDTKRKPYLKDGIDIKGWKIASLPYLVWAPIEKTPAEKGIIRSLKNLAKKADSVVIGTDFDREGELIGSDALRQIREVAPDVPVSRARYSAFTKAEIDHAFNNLVELDQDLADAGESRQYIDLIWGAVLTRYLTTARFSGFGNTRSAGRVQTPTLALVVERERERMAFKPEDYWVIFGEASHGEDDPFKVSHTTARFWDKDAADAAYANVAQAKEARVTAVERKSRTQRPPAPFNTTSLQAAAAAEGISPARAMRLAESLYMDGLISYPRVDNTVYPSSLDLKDCVRTISKVPQYAPTCKALLSQPKLTATRGKQETTDHPPIYPTGAADPEKLQPAAWKLYNLIARRFLATLMGPATIEGTKVTFDVNGEPFQASGNVLADPGFRSIYPYGLKKDDQLPELHEGDVCDVEKMDLLAKQTEPPARYSQGKLIQEMEKRGLGTKSTRASIIDTLYQRKYLKNDPCEPSQLGMAIIDALNTYAPRITTPEMTSELEDDMTKVAEGTDTQTQVVTHSRALLAGMMDGLIEHTEDLSEAIADAVTADAKIGVCPKCGRDLVVKTSAKTRGSFAGCMGWPDCDVTYPLPQGRIEALEGEAAVCPDCGAPRIKVQPFRQKAYETCINPACPTNREPDVEVGVCHACAEAGRTGKLIAHKSERTGKRFIRCTNYDDCGTSYPLPQRGKLEATGEECPDCGAPMVIVTTARGPWKLCPNMDCPGREKKAAAGRGRGRGTGTKAASAKKPAVKKAAAKKPAVKKTTAKKKA
ncbi:MAG: DNA topoisomerase I [Paratractidigestivibacter faecalis]|uniref:DNA topoisomerase I n=1 Tax=Paratractidigestivibacter faecalis TaxID=2292441 RepID=UPI0026EB7931|nr:DNA topoisomerase I [Paratractidigestivibacter faecalis]MDD6417685.1 DNA topoisomerase I [Paratractidigestivibacter faecalis]